ncbi:glycosyl hydrolase family 95 catalytic domain-containing protein [Aquiflexum sp.]|uniref:glycosyl hydrolase family 95 catalytic domain-containing protein n=1 Tax=Aquiflexum sp. TaxID=1872584 RepID=UPI003593E93E
MTRIFRLLTFSILFAGLLTRNYRQELDIYTGVLTTSYGLFGQTRVTAFAHQTIPNLFVMKIDRQSREPGKEMVITINCQTHKTQQTSIGWPPEPVKLAFDIKENRADIVSSTNMVDTHWSVLVNNESTITLSKNNLKIHLKDGENIIRFIVYRDESSGESITALSYDELLTSHKSEWEENWNRSYIDFSEDRAHHIWNRANYYNLSNFPVTPEKALIPTGLNTNIWGFTFPQDVYYVVENLTRTGHFDRYEKSMQYWLDILPEVKKYSQRIMGLEGGYYPWTPPFAMWDEFEKEGVVGTDSYQIHNPAYVAAMVWHYYLRTNDQEFLQKYFPIMEEVWRFYSQVLHKSERGTYDVFHHTATSQDEHFRKTDSKNYLDASLSAEYTLRNYLLAAEILKSGELDLVEKAKEIKQAGLERDALLNQYGYFNTFEGDDRAKNSQKHPVQLNAITFVPMADRGMAQPTVTAWENRYDLTSEARKPISQGWTYAAFALSSSRMGSPEGLNSDLHAIQYAAHADPRWVQFYEYTFWERYTLHTAYYFVTHGLYQQALSDALVQDWQGFADIFATVLPQWENRRFSFKGLHTLKWVSVDGVWDNGHFRIVLNPNGAQELPLRISGGKGNIKVTGARNDISSIKTGEEVLVVFEGDNPVVFENQKK